MVPCQCEECTKRISELVAESYELGWDEGRTDFRQAMLVAERANKRWFKWT